MRQREQLPIRARCVPLVVFAGVLAMRLAAQTVTEPEILGRLVGPGASALPASVEVYGSDLGWTFEHEGELQILFGDTWSHARSLCEEPPFADDAQGVLPRAWPGAGVPPVRFTTGGDGPRSFALLELYRDGESQRLGYGQVPIAGFSDGENAFAIFGRADYVRCARGEDGESTCGGGLAGPGFECSPTVGACVPATLGLSFPCDLEGGGGCSPLQRCEPADPGFCVDPGSSQIQSGDADAPYAVVQTIDVAVRDADRPQRYHSVAAWRTNRLTNLTARTITALPDGAASGDYRPGHGALLVWGRPGYTAEKGRQSQLYLMVHDLPLPTDRSGDSFRPRYFAGLDNRGGPRFSSSQAEAAPLAMDGRPEGDSHEEVAIVDQLAVAWLGPPISRWMMLYGGDLPDLMLRDAAASRSRSPSPGAILARFAEHPWGPWSEPRPHLLPGRPDRAGDPYGPGGVLFHHECRGADCAHSDPSRPLHLFRPGCEPPAEERDVGRFYGPNIIDAWTRPAGEDAIEVYWNLSTWNPYGVVLLRSIVRASG